MMSGVLIRSNLSCSDLDKYFCSQWSDHLASQARGWLTDMRMVAREGSVEVHRAVILPLCPLLGIIERDIIQEDPTVILPDHPVELLQSFVNLIYKGSTTMSDVVTIRNLLELMTSLGLNMPVNCLVVDREEINEVETVVCKKHDGLEIIEVNNNCTPLLFHSDHSARRQSLEITTCLLNPKQAKHCLGKPVINPKRKLEGKAASDKMEMNLPKPQNIEQTDENKNINPSTHEVRPVEVKLECEEFVVKDVEPSTRKKRKWNRRRETLDIPLHSCEFCDFKCRFIKSLQDHCDKLHRDKHFKCCQCQFNASSFASLKDHKRKRHAGFGTKRKKELAWHKLNIHAAGDFQVRSDKLFNNAGEGSLDLPDVGDKTSEGVSLKVYLANGLDDTMCKETSNETNMVKASEEILNFEIDRRSTIDVGAWDSTMEEIGHTEEQQAGVPEVTKVEEAEGLVSQVEKNVNQVENCESNADVECELKEIENSEGVDKRTSGHVEELKATNLGELVAFKCGVAGCKRVSRVRCTTATYALNRLKAHFANAHKHLEDSQFTYINIYKEGTKPTCNQIEDNPSLILKKVKTTHRPHRKTSIGSLPIEKTKKVKVRIGKKRIIKKPNMKTNSITNAYNHSEDEHKAHPVENVFKPEWLDSKSLLFDINGDRLSSYLSPVPSSPSMATCLACKISFSISVLGVGQVYRHARQAQHKEIRRLRDGVGWMGAVQGEN